MAKTDIDYPRLKEKSLHEFPKEIVVPERHRYCANFSVDMWLRPSLFVVGARSKNKRIPKQAGWMVRSGTSDDGDYWFFRTR